MMWSTCECVSSSVKRSVPKNSRYAPPGKPGAGVRMIASPPIFTNTQLVAPPKMRQRSP